MTDKKTHVERPDPQISVNRLADFMAASEQTKRTILGTCKYRQIARVIQHRDARAIIAEYLCSATRNAADLEEKLEALQSRICDDQFEVDVNQHNCDYIRRFIAVIETLDLPNAEYTKVDSLPDVMLGGTKVTFRPQVLASRITRRNTHKSGVLMLRYAKAQPLRPEVAHYQSAFMFGYLANWPVYEESAPEKSLCLTVDCYSGSAYPAPGNAIYRFKEIAAACAGIAERWAAIKPPPGAIL